MNIRLTWTLISVSVSFGWAGTIPFERDRTLERALRWEASADKTITPQKVIRHLFGGNKNAPLPSTEFQPIVNVHNERVQVIASIAYKF